MLRIRFARGGRKNLPHYFIRVMDARTKRDGKGETIGYYRPTINSSNPDRFVLNLKKFNDLVALGAQPSESLLVVMKRHKNFVDQMAQSQGVESIRL